MRNLSLIAIILSLGSIVFAQGVTKDSKPAPTTNEGEKQSIVVVNPVTKPTDTKDKGEKAGTFWQSTHRAPIQIGPTNVKN